MCCWLSSLHVNLLSKSWKRSPCSVKSLGVKELIWRGHWCHMPHQQILVSRSSKQPCCQHSRIFLSLSHVDDKLICVSLEMRNLLHFVLNNNEIGDAGGVLGLTVTLRQYSVLMSTRGELCDISWLHSGHLKLVQHGKSHGAGEVSKILHYRHCEDWEPFWICIEMRNLWKYSNRNKGIKLLTLIFMYDSSTLAAWSSPEICNNHTKT